MELKIYIYIYITLEGRNMENAFAFQFTSSINREKVSYIKIIIIINE